MLISTQVQQACLAVRVSALHSPYVATGTYPGHDLSECGDTRSCAIAIGRMLVTFSVEALALSARSPHLTNEESAHLLGACCSRTAH